MPTSYIVCRTDLPEKGKDREGHYCGTGPYRFHSWKHDRELKLSVNKEYFSAQPAGLEGLTYYIIPEDFTAMAELKKGRLDIMEIPTALLPDFQNTEGPVYNITNEMTLSTYYIGINCRKPYLKDKETRRAIAMCINRESLVKHLMENSVVLARGPVPQVLPGSVEKEALPYAPEEARQILAKKPIHNMTLRFFAKSSRQNTDIVSAVGSDLRSAGLKVEMELRDWSRFKDAVNEGKADLFFLSWWADIPDGIDFLYPTFHSSNHGAAGNRSFFHDEEVDALIDQARKTATEKERFQLYRRISQKIVEEVPWVFLWHKKSYYAVSKRISGFRVYPMYNMDKGEDYKIKNQK